MLSGLLNPLLTAMDRFVIGNILGMPAVAAYAIAFNVVLRIGALPSSYENALYPRFPMLHANEARALHVRAVRVVACVMTPVLVIGLVLIKPFLTLWIGNVIATQVAPIGELLLVGMWFYTMSFIPVAFFESRGAAAVPVLFRAFELIVYVPTLFFLTRHFGVTGAAWAWGTRALVDVILLFSALRMLPSLISAWHGVLVLCATYIFVSMAFVSGLTFCFISLALVFVSIFSAISVLPADTRTGALVRMKMTRLGKSPAFPL